MTSSFVSLLHAVVYHPFCSLSIVLIVWMWASLFFQEIDIRRFSLSYHDCFKQRQYWRVFTAVVAHSSTLHFLINVNCLWNLRYLEDFYGSFYMFKYTIVLAITEMLLSFGLMAVTIRLSRNNPSLQSLLHSLQSHGCSGIILSWLIYQSIVEAHSPIHPVFFLFGFLNISTSFAPLLMLVVFYVVTGRGNMYSNSSGMVNGYLLSSGLLLFLPSTYWSWCFLVDVFALVAVTSFATATATATVTADVSQSLSFRTYQGENHEEFIELQYDLDHSEDGGGTGSSSSSGGLAGRGPSTHGGGHFRPRNEYDEEALEPLLEDGVEMSVMSSNVDGNGNGRSRGSFGGGGSGGGEEDGDEVERDSSLSHMMTASLRRTLAFGRSTTAYERVIADEH
jgi:membrane associated rhomboid family serine protease